ncbi:MAG: tetratricopeptide repeat protein [Bacteroidia bacterium]
MPVDKNNMDDLEYLSQLGFEKVPISDADLKDLNSNIKKRVFSYNNGLYFGFISLIVGVFMGVSLFFMVDNRPVIFASNTPNKILNDTLPVKKEIAQKTIVLDTINVLKENFINPLAHSKVTTYLSTVASVSVLDTAIEIPSKPIDISMIVENINESKLKYIVNAPIVYIHDLKVTNYTSLYFKKNQYIKFPIKDGLPVSYANKDEYAKNRSGLKQSADYFLHEEFSDALLSFKKKNYDQCLYALNIISSYNDADLNCNFYSGMCYYYKKNYPKAVEFFERCINSPNNSFLQEAMYYNALAMYEGGDKQTAIEKFKLIADEGEFYSEKAKTFLKN